MNQQHEAVFTVAHNLASRALAEAHEAVEAEVASMFFPADYGPIRNAKSQGEMLQCIAKAMLRRAVDKLDL